MPRAVDEMAMRTVGCLAASLGGLVCSRDSYVHIATSTALLPITHGQVAALSVGNGSANVLCALWFEFESAPHCTYLVLTSQVVRWQRAKARQGTHKVKDRSEVGQGAPWQAVQLLTLSYTLYTVTSQLHLTQGVTCWLFQ